MTGPTIEQERLTPTQEDREAAWPHRAGIFKEADRDRWMDGVYDKLPLIQSFTARRLAAPKSADEWTEDEVRASIRASIAQPDMGQNLFARMHGIHAAHLSEFLNGKRTAEPEILRGCGFRWAIVRDDAALKSPPMNALLTQMEAREIAFREALEEIERGPIVTFEFDNIQFNKRSPIEIARAALLTGAGS